MRSVVEQIKDRLPITDVLASYITLQQSGNQYKARCPFHNERTASFSVSPEKGLYYCFGCGAKGDIFSFVEKFEGLDFPGTLKLLAERAGVPLEQKASDERDMLYSFIDEQMRKYEQALTKKSDILAYLSSRGVSKETIEKFHIGYASPEWREIASTVVGTKKEALAIATGLLKESPKGYYDRFRSRIMFPLFDSSGRVIAFSGRLFGEEGSEAPKYLNSPETVLFKKSATLYGFDKAKYAIKKYDYAILVEGQFDLVLLHQAGFINTVATSGTAVSEDSITDSRSALHTLSRLTSNIILAFDGDSAGEKATLRTAAILLSLGMNIKIMSLPEKKDPADVVLEGGAALCKQLITEAKNLFVWVTENIKVHGYSPHLLRRALEKDMFPLLQRVHSEVEKRGYITDIAQMLEVSPDALSRDYESFSLTHTYMQTEEEQSVGAEESYSPDELLQAFVLHYPESKGEIEKMLREEGVTLEEKEELRPALLFFVESQYGKLNTVQKEQTLSELIKKVSVSHHRHQLVQLKKALYGMDPGTDEYQNTLAHIDQLQKKIHTRFHTET